MSDPDSNPPESRWDQLKDKAKEAWEHLTDDDLDVSEGDYDGLVGRIKAKTGESDKAVHDRLQGEREMESKYYSTQNDIEASEIATEIL